MGVSATSAAAVFRQAADSIGRREAFDAQWADKVHHLSQLCAQGKAATHIAFLGASILAKATDETVDLFAIKPDHAPGNPRAYSARILCHSVLVPLASEYNVHIGVTGREPLNNQPYFRMTALGDGTPVHVKSRPAFDYMIGLIQELARANSQQAKDALRSFIAVRQQYWPRYATGTGNLSVDSETLAACIDSLVRENSENGARAQASAAGLLDVFAGDGRVVSGRINDPSRHYPGDVVVTNEGNNGTVVIEKAIEVRDKPVSESDVRVFTGRCLTMGVREAAVLMVSPLQELLNDGSLKGNALSSGIGLTLFYGWPRFVEQVLFWASAPKVLATLEVVDRIEARLIAVEASEEAVAKWQALVRV